MLGQNKCWTKTKVGPKQKLGQEKSWAKIKVGPIQKLYQNHSCDSNKIWATAKSLTNTKGMPNIKKSHRRNNCKTAAITIPITTVKKAEMTAAMTVTMKNIQIKFKLN